MHYCLRFAGVATAPAEPAVPILPKVDFAVALKAVSLETLSSDLWPSAKLAGELSAESSQPLSLPTSWFASCSRLSHARFRQAPEGGYEAICLL